MLPANLKIKTGWNLSLADQGRQRPNLRLFRFCHQHPDQAVNKHDEILIKNGPKARFLLRKKTYE